MVFCKSVGRLLNEHGHLGRKELGLVVDCIIAQQIFTSPSPPHHGRNTIPHSLDIEISHVTCFGQKYMCGSDRGQLQDTQCVHSPLLSSCHWS